MRIEYKIAIALLIVIVLIGADRAVNPHHCGLGDTVANVLQKLGIEKRPGCGCENRHRWLNKHVPYNGQGCQKRK